MSTVIAEFTVVGTPVAQGSMRSFERAGRTFTKSGNAGPLEKWRGDIRSALTRSAAAGANPRFAEIGNSTTGPISMRLAFRLARPKDHYLPANSRRAEPELRPDAPTYGGKGDIDKLVRAVLDALTKLAYLDDSQVVVIGATKEYSAPALAGVDVRVSAL